MNKYTVVVLYPKGTDDYPRMTFTAWVEAETPFVAREYGARKAQNKQPPKERGKIESWFPLVVFDGHIQPLAYGWQP